MERLKTIEDVLISQVQSQLGNLQQVDANELGEVVDMIKDMEEAIYYCTITKAMKQSEKDDYSEIKKDIPYPRYREQEMPIEFHDYREGNSPKQRKMYMESKELHKDKETQMKELERYMQELTSDIIDMIKDATPEEKQLLQKKISTLAAKISV